MKQQTHDKKPRQTPERDYRCVNYESCLNQAAHTGIGYFGFDCVKCGGFSERSASLIFGLDDERDSKGFQRSSKGRYG